MALGVARVARASDPRIPFLHEAFALLSFSLYETAMEWFSYDAACAKQNPRKSLFSSARYRVTRVCGENPVTIKGGTPSTLVLLGLNDSTAVRRDHTMKNGGQANTCFYSFFSVRLRPRGVVS